MKQKKSLKITDLQETILTLNLQRNGPDLGIS